METIWSAGLPEVEMTRGNEEWFLETYELYFMADELVWHRVNPTVQPPGERLCEEASPLSFSKYIPCGEPAKHIVYSNRDNRSYYMCESCSDNNLSNRGGRLVI